MSQNTRIAAITLLTALATSPALAQERTGGPITPNASRIREHHQARTQSTVVAAPVASPVVASSQVEQASYEVTTGGDPYGFTAVLNRLRAAAGLHPVAYDPQLSSWASQNNAVQCLRGIGHHYNPAGIQNCGWNYNDAQSAAQGWMESPGHRQNMLSPSISRIGIAFGPGPYWTMNAR